MPHLTHSGNTLEGIVKSAISGKGFEVVSYSEWHKHPYKYGEELLLMGVPYQTIYNHKGRTEFLLKSKRYNLEIRIECKWQQSAGSVDEKLPYLYLNAIETMPEGYVIVLIDGAGWKRGAIEWLKQAVAEKKYMNLDASEKVVKVLNIAEFTTWANQTFRD